MLSQITLKVFSKTMIWPREMVKKNIERIIYLRTKKSLN